MKHGTLTMGFIGLAETLKALTGYHHGESKEAQNLGLEIVGYMRQRMDQATKKHGMNFSLIATPAEGLSGRFVRMDAENSEKSPALLIGNIIPTPSTSQFTTTSPPGIRSSWRLHTTPSPTAAISPMWSWTVILQRIWTLLSRWSAA